jgi:hypothetical protein
MDRATLFAFTLPCAAAIAIAAHAQISGPAAEAAHQSEIASLAATLRAHWSGTAGTEPALTAGHIITPSIDVRRAPGVPALQVTLTNGTVGAAYFSVGIVSPSGIRYYATSGDGRLPAFPPPPQTQTINVRLKYPFGASLAGIYTPPGIWNIYKLELVSLDGTVIDYDARQLSAILPGLGITVANSGTPDSVPPAIAPGRILTPLIRLGNAPAYLAARLPVSDDLSGVARVSIVATAPPPDNTTTIATGAVIDYPVHNASVTTTALLPPDTVPGTYTIQYIYACDVATNCAYLSKTADIQAALGANTFQVIN